MSLKVGGVLLRPVGVLAGRGAMAEPMLPVLRYDPPGQLLPERDPAPR